MDAESEAAADKAKDRIIEIQGSLFSKSAAYTNLILLGGYAGAFTIWGNTKQLLSPLANAAVGLLLLVSLVVFICFEVFKMVRQSFHLRAAVKQVKDAKTPEEFLRLWKAFEQEILKRDFLNYSVWVFCLGTCVVTAISAVLILLYHFCVSLLAVLPF